jgi:hypothetical protein
MPNSREYLLELLKHLIDRKVAGERFVTRLSKNFEGEKKGAGSVLDMGTAS